MTTRYARSGALSVEPGVREQEQSANTVSRAIARDELGVREHETEFPGIEEEHEYEWSSDITQINHRLELFIQQQQLKDDKINKLERRIKELEHWKISRISTS